MSKNSIYVLMMVSFLLALSSCAVDDAANENANFNDDQTASVEAPQNAIYKVIFIGEWTADSHPNAFPPANDHFSSMVVLSHNSSTKLFAVDNLASRGIEHMAEDGANSNLVSEMESHIEEGAALDFGVGKVITGNGTDTLTINFSQDFSKLSYVAMIAPSPDWFVGLSNISLFENDAWVERLELDVNAYDAGTEDGSEFRYDNPETSPQQNISRITEAPLGNGSTVSPSLGKLIIELQD